MPLKQSSSRAAFESNVRAEREAGRPPKQALAIAYAVKRRNRATGGPAATPWYTRNEARAMTHTGPINSAVAGRTDHHPMNVPSGAYVLPADHVSSLGQGNTASGMAVLNQMFGAAGPYGAGRSMPMRRGPGAPRRRATGGSAPSDEAEPAPVPINAAGGEYVIPPEAVIAVGGGDIKRGHAILDQWVVANRKSHMRTLGKLPGPAKS